MAYPIVSIASRDYAVKDVLMSDVLNIAKMKTGLYEKQLTRILSTITGGTVNAQTLSCEERYAIFLHYLDLTRDHNDLSVEINPAEYLAPNLADFSNERVEGKNGITVRHLNGMEAEALELGCEHTEDWILGAMAITIGCELLPPLDIPTTVEYCAKMIHSRIEILSSMDTVQFNKLMADYLDAQYEQAHLVNIAFDQGIVLEKFALRGADDAPRRFRPTIAFTGYAKDMLLLASRENTAI